jgi:small subunit ribosomal protein S16
MATKIRLARGGSKKRPFYSIVVTDSRMPRDGRFLEKLGTYNPMLAKDDANRVVMNVDRAKELLATGAQPTDRVARFLEAAGVLAKKVRSNPKTGTPGKAMAERAAKKAARAEALLSLIPGLGLVRRSITIALCGASFWAGVKFAESGQVAACLGAGGQIDPHGVCMREGAAP